jgi:phospholipid/cholesterol/gamma-HCH transport system permease protein
MLGGFVASNISSDMAIGLYFRKAFAIVEFADVVPAVLKTIFFGFAIGFVGCFKGYHAGKGTESVGLAANSAVVAASLWVIVLDAIAVQLTSVIAYN